MQDILTCAMGLDVHRDIIVACLVKGAVDAEPEAETRTFSTLIPEMQKLRDWVIEQESKYSAELEDALKQYAELKAQAADVDAVELMDARLDIRPDRERSAADRVKVAYGDKYDPLMMYDSKRDVANLLMEEAEARSVREFLRKQHKLHGHEQQRKMKHDRER